MKQTYSCLSRPQAFRWRQILPTRKVLCRRVCGFVTRQLGSIRRIALARSQRALNPSAAPSFAQALTKRWIPSDVAACGSNSINCDNRVIADQLRRNDPGKGRICRHAGYATFAGLPPERGG